MNVIEFEKLCNESLFTKDAFRCYKRHLARMSATCSQEAVYIHEADAKKYAYGLWMYFASRGKETHDYSPCEYCLKLNGYIGTTRRIAIDKLISKALEG